MLVCLVALNDAPPVIWPAADWPAAWTGLYVATRAALADNAVHRIAVELVDDDGHDWRTWRAPNGDSIAMLLADTLRYESLALWERWQVKTGAVVTREAVA